MKIGIISDTHGMLRQEVVQIFQDCEFIFHAGDIGKEKIISELSSGAPVIAVRGNNDKDNWGQKLSDETYTKVNNLMIYMIHDLKESKVSFEKSNIDIIISGHSHIYKEEIKNGICYLNPGSAGARRFGRPATAMVLEMECKVLKIQKIIF